MQCPKCSEASVKDANFCHVCSFMLKPYCVLCRLDLPANSRFCFRCAHPLSSTEEQKIHEKLEVKKSSKDTTSEKKSTDHLSNSLPEDLASKYQLAQKAITSERKLVSIVFADLSGFTSLSEKLDPEKVTEIMNRCFQRLGKIVYEHEGYIDKFMGDCIMALFGAPIAHENDPELAIDCALKMLEELKKFSLEESLPLGMSIGINSGMVVAGGVGSDQKFEYTVMGDAVNVAQRLQSAAKAGQILVSKIMSKLCQNKFDFETHEPIRVKGKEAPIDIFSVIGKKKTHLKERGVQSGYSKLIGREREVQIIEKLLDELDNDRGQILLMSGEPGVGKSRLKHEMKKFTLARGNRWLEAKCTNLNRETPYFVFIDLLHHLFEIDEKAEPAVLNEQIKKIKNYKLDKISEHLIRDLLNIPSSGEDEPINLTNSQKKRAIFVALKNLIFRWVESSAATIYLEDLHWLDPISEELLQSLLDSVPEFPLLFAAGTRPDVAHGWNTKRNFTQISLGSLTPQQCLQLVQTILNLTQIPKGLQNLIESKSDGNPLYVEEIIKSLIDSGDISKTETGWMVSDDLRSVEMPATLQGIIASRIDRLPDEVKLVLQYASIIGRRFSDTLLEKAAKFESLHESLKILRKRELIFEVSSEYDEIVYMFNHALVQEVAYESILSKTRKQFHARVGVAIEELFNTDSESTASEYLEALAYHYSESAVHTKAVDYLRRSGKRMADNFSNEGAIKSYLKAISILEANPDPQFLEENPVTSDLYFLLSEVYLLMGDFDSAEKYQWKYLELGSKKNSPSHLAKSYRRLGEISLKRGHFEKALEHFHVSLEFSVRLNDFEGQVRTYKGLANTWNKMHDLFKAIEMFEKGIQGAKTLGNPLLMAEYLNDKATVLIELNQISEAQKYLEESIALSKDRPTFRLILISATLNLGVVQYFQKDIQGALAKFRETAKLSDQIGDL
ncbi:MAG: adenylate/guanylate cyclase, partial [Bacteriovoracaceae bacterium]|nr:adenylate/guanylate cyclase [Bacteriovoracaceae bacterium]